MSEKTVINKKYLENLVKKAILAEQMGVGEPFGGPAGSLHGKYDPKDELPTWEGTKKWWSGFGRAVSQLTDFVGDNISRDIQFKNQAPLQGVANVKLSENKKYEDFIKSYFMFYSKFSFNDFYCDPDPDLEQEIENSEDKINEILLFERKRASDPTRKSCDYFANYTGWMIADSTSNWLLKPIEKERKPTITKGAARARSALGGSRPQSQTGQPFGSIGGIQRENYEQKYLKEEEESNTLNRGQMATYDGVEKKECPTLHIDGAPVNDELQKQFCEFRVKKWREYVNSCLLKPDTSWCKETEETSKVEKLNIFDEYGQPGQGFEDETAFIFKDYLQMQSRTSTSLSGIGGEFDDIDNVADASKDASRIYAVLKSELKEYFTSFDDSDHAWMRFTGPFAYAAVDMAVDDASAILSSYMLVPEKYFVENIKVLSENINELLRDRDRSSRGLREVYLPKSGNILDYVPNFVIKLLSIRIFRHVFTAKELVELIVDNISRRQHKDDKRSLERCLKKIKKNIISEIETREGKKLHQAFYNYLILSSLDPAGDEVTESDILAMVNLEENPGEDFTLGQQLLAFLAVSTPEAQLVMQPLLNGLVHTGRVAMTANRTAPKGGWWTAIITGTIFVGQVAWFFLDPINRVNLETMKDQFDDILKDMKIQKDIAIRNRKEKIIERYKKRGQSIDPSEVQTQAENSFRFTRKQVNNIKQGINTAIEELSYEINQAVEMTLSNISQKGGLSSDNLEKRLTIIKSYVAVGQTLKSSINQLDRVELYINSQNWQDAFDAIKKSKDQAVELFQNTKVPDTAISLEEQSSPGTFVASNPDRNIPSEEMEKLIVNCSNYLHKNGASRKAKQLNEFKDSLLVLYYAGPLLVQGQMISRQIGFSLGPGGNTDYWKSVLSRANQIKKLAGFDSYLDKSDVKLFNNCTLTSWDLQNTRAKPDMLTISGIKKNYILEGFYTSRLQNLGKEEMGDSEIELAAIPYAFGYDGMINRYGYQGSVFVSQPFEESFDSIKDEFFGIAIPKVLPAGSNEYHDIIDPGPAKATWSQKLYKYKNQTKGAFDPVKALASLGQVQTGGRKNILSIINSISESNDWDLDKVKKLQQLSLSISNIEIPKLDLSSLNPSERIKIEVVQKFLETFYYKMNFDKKLVEAFNNIEKEYTSLNKSDIQSPSVDFEKIWNNTKKENKPTVRDDQKRRRFHKRVINTVRPKIKPAMMKMAKYMAAVERFVAIDNTLRGIQDLDR